jgi:hypothetical protein
MLLFLSIVLLVTLLMQGSRSTFLLTWNGEDGSGGLSQAAPVKNALSPMQREAIAEERFLIVYDPNRPFSVRMKDNVERVLAGMKKTYSTVEAGAELPKLDRQDAVILTFSDWSLIRDRSWLTDYAQAGGNVLLFGVPDLNDGFYSLYRQVGILEAGEYVETKGLTLQSNVLVGYGGASFHDDSLQNAALRVKLSDKASVLATAEGKYPLLWKTPYGNGAFLVFNGTMLQEKTSRGLIAGSIGLMLPDFVYPVINAKVMFIDDFPAPFPNGEDANISRLYHMEVRPFFKKIWWPDMSRMAREHQLRYTGALIVTYGDDVGPPFDWTRDGSVEALLTYGRDLLKGGGEIGVHGYNHQSLTNEPNVASYFGYKVWDDPVSMRESLQSLREFVASIFPNYRLRTYVPPSNALGTEGRAILKEALPDLTNIGSLYGEDAEQISYVQELGTAGDGIFELPRISSGYDVDMFGQWTVANSVTTLGYVSHFVHPDDVLDERRNRGEAWPELLKSFDRFLTTLDQRHGWLRGTTAAEAAVEAKRWEMADPVFEHKPGQLKGYINGFSGEAYLILRTEKKMGRLRGCQVERLDANVYLIRATEETFTIEWADGT